MDLNGQRVVILGGGSGLGLATAEAAAREGASVVVVSHRRESVDRALASLPRAAEGHAVDVTDENAIVKFFGTVGAFDHLVFTAGDGLLLAPLDSLEPDQARRAFDTRYWGAFNSVRHGAPHIRKGGSIVLTSGIAGNRPLKGWSIAASICGAMEALTRALAVELAPIRVNAVSPGLIKTPLWRGMSEADREGMYAHVAATLPIGRVGETADIAQTYVYLMREGYGTGQVLTVDGGGALI